MLLENELVPFEPTLLLGERLLVLAPHPDDEVLGCGGLVALHAAARRTISVVIATDGAGAANAGSDPAAYRERREREAAKGLAVLGAPAPRFLRLRDRLLEADSPLLAARLRELFAELRPDLVVAPSPLEMHPDHVALATTLLRVVREPELPPGLEPSARVAFCEVSQPIRPNALVDISSLAELKRQAANEHASQHDLRDYGRFARGLNDYRAMSLAREVTAAEGYWVAAVGDLRATSLNALRDAMSPVWQLGSDGDDPGRELRRVRDELRERERECLAVGQLLDEHREAVTRQTETINDLFREIDRLNALVDTMRNSKRWKLHEALGRLTGRG
jgi:LmbE family N-acetylglucosaminyl deacetylase